MYRPLNTIRGWVYSKLIALWRRTHSIGQEMWMTSRVNYTSSPIREALEFKPSNNALDNTYMAKIVWVLIKIVLPF